MPLTAEDLRAAQQQTTGDGGPGDIESKARFDEWMSSRERPEATRFGDLPPVDPDIPTPVPPPTDGAGVASGAAPSADIAPLLDIGSPTVMPTSKLDAGIKDADVLSPTVQAGAGADGAPDVTPPSQMTADGRGSGEGQWWLQRGSRQASARSLGSSRRRSGTGGVQRLRTPTGILSVEVTGGWGGQVGVMVCAAICILRVTLDLVEEALLQEYIVRQHYLETDAWVAARLQDVLQDAPVVSSHHRDALLSAEAVHATRVGSRSYTPIRTRPFIAQPTTLRSPRPPRRPPPKGTSYTGPPHNAYLQGSPNRTQKVRVKPQEPTSSASGDTVSSAPPRPKQPGDRDQASCASLGGVGEPLMKQTSSLQGLSFNVVMQGGASSAGGGDNANMLYEGGDVLPPPAAFVTSRPTSPALSHTSEALVSAAHSAAARSASRTTDGAGSKGGTEHVDDVPEARDAPRRSRVLSPTSASQLLFPMSTRRSSFVEIQAAGTGSPRKSVRRENNVSLRMSPAAQPAPVPSEVEAGAGAPSDDPNQQQQQQLRHTTSMLSPEQHARRDVEFRVSQLARELLGKSRSVSPQQEGGGGAAWVDIDGLQVHDGGDDGDASDVSRPPPRPPSAPATNTQVKEVMNTWFPRRPARRQRPSSAPSQRGVYMHNGQHHGGEVGGDVHADTHPGGGTEEHPRSTGCLQGGVYAATYVQEHCSATWDPTTGSYAYVDTHHPDGTVIVRDEDAMSDSVYPPRHAPRRPKSTTRAVKQRYKILNDSKRTKQAAAIHQYNERTGDADWYFDEAVSEIGGGPDATWDGRSRFVTWKFNPPVPPKRKQGAGPHPPHPPAKISKKRFDAFLKRQAVKKGARARREDDLPGSAALPFSEVKRMLSETTTVRSEAEPSREPTPAIDVEEAAKVEAVRRAKEQRANALARFKDAQTAIQTARLLRGEVARPSRHDSTPVMERKLVPMIGRVAGAYTTMMEKSLSRSQRSRAHSQSQSLSQRSHSQSLKNSAASSMNSKPSHSPPVSPTRRAKLSKAPGGAAFAAAAAEGGAAEAVPAPSEEAARQMPAPRPGGEGATKRRASSGGQHGTDDDGSHGADEGDASAEATRGVKLTTPAAAAAAPPANPEDARIAEVTAKVLQDPGTFAKGLASGMEFRETAETLAERLGRMVAQDNSEKQKRTENDAPESQFLPAKKTIASLTNDLLARIDCAQNVLPQTRSVKDIMSAVDAVTNA